MIDGVKIEDWDFMFEQYSPECEKKLNDLIRKYFDNAINETYNSKKLIERLKNMKKRQEIGMLNAMVKREGMYDDYWLLNIPTMGLFKKEVVAPTKGYKMDLLKSQLICFSSMLEKIRSNE